MNKKILIVTIATLLLLLGCGKVMPKNNAKKNGQSPLVETKISPSLIAETKDQSYSITTATFSQDNIVIQYPQIKGLGDNSKEKIINDLIKNDLLKNEVEEPIDTYGDGTLTMKLNYQVTMNTPELLSVVYTGNSKVEGAAFPTNDIYAITIDLNNATKLKLSDFTDIDTKLAKKIKQSTAVTNDAVKNDGMDKNVLITVIQNTDDQTLLKGLEEEWAYNTFYVTSNSLVVSIDVGHAIGDYALIEILGQYTNSKTKRPNSADGKDELNSASNSKNNISELQKSGLEIIEKQSFWVDFEKWGKVKFVSSEIPDKGSFKLQFYLIDDKGTILYTFPEFYGSQTWSYYELRSISFRDVNKDELKDVIVIADYVSGAGEAGAIPFPVAGVYFQKDKSFVSLPELDSEINDANKNESIDIVIKYIESKNIKFDK